MIGQPQNTDIETGTDDHGTRTLTLKNNITVNGHVFTPSYVFKFVPRSGEIKSPQISSLTEPNVVEIPVDSWDQDSLESAFRKVTIANKLLYPRFVRTSMQPEKYQVQALADMRASIEARGSCLVVMATGSGKTPVAFWANNELLTDIRKTEPHKGVFLFIVNNKVILGEAEEKLVGDGTEKNKGLFGDKYSASRIYDSEYNPNGDFIFCSVASLARDNRTSRLIKDLINQGKHIAGVVVDETHHLPAEEARIVFSQIEEASIKNQWNTVPYGFTATDIRPDKQSLLPFFGGVVAYEFNIVDGWNQGYLVPVDYLASYDTVTPYLNPSGLVDASSLQGLSKKEIFYGEYRFHELLEKYQIVTSQKPYNASLFVCPEVEKAEALAKYFRNHGIQAVALHGNTNQQKFDDYYYAFKHGKWPKDSTYSEEPIPECIMAVDLFREGTDAPRINNLFLFDDTNSIIRYMQSIGRGERPWEGKTHLTIVDTVGCIGKMHLMHYLFGMAGKSRSETTSLGAGKEGGSSSQGTRIHPATLESSLSGMRFDSKLSETLKRNLDNIPTTLEMRYGSYPNIPTREKLLLDKFIAKYAEFSSEAELREYLLTVTENLESPGGMPGDDIVEFRRRFKKVFYDECYNLGHPDTIFYTSRSSIIFHRLASIVSELNPEFNLEKLYTLLPEFDKNLKGKIDQCAANLKVLRQYVFRGQSQTDVLKYLIKNIPPGRLSRDVQIELLACEYEINTGELPFSISWAEGQRAEYDTRNLQDNVRVSSKSRYALTANVESQNVMIESYLACPQIHNSGLSRDDFYLPRNQFVNRLLDLNLIQISTDDRRFFQTLDRYTTQYHEAAVNKQVQLSALRGNLKNLLSNETIDIDPRKLTDTRAGQLLEASNKIDKALIALGPAVTDDDREIRHYLDVILEEAGVIRKRDLSELGISGVELIFARGKSDKCSIGIRAKGLNAEDLAVGVKEDFAGNKMVCLYNAKTLHSGLVGYSNLQEFYKTLPPLQISTIINQVISTVQYLGEQHGGNLTILIPVDQSGETFFADLNAAFLAYPDTQDWNVVGLIDTICERGLKFQYRTVSGSRIDLSPRDLGTNRRKLKLDGNGMANNFAYLILSVLDFRNNVLPGWEDTQKRLAGYDVENCSPLECKALHYLIEKIQTQIDKPVTGFHRRNFLIKLFDLLGRYSVDPMNKRQLMISATYHIASEKVWEGHKSDVQSLLVEYSRVLNHLKESDTELIDQNLHNRVEQVCEQIVTRFFDTKFLPGTLDLGDIKSLSRSLQEECNKLLQHHKEQQQSLAPKTTNIKPVDSAAVVDRPPNTGRFTPPLFNSDGKVILWMTRGKRTSKGLRGKPDTYTWVAHWDPGCVKLRESETTIQTNTDGVPFKSFRMCSCSPPFRNITNTIEGVNLKNKRRLSDEQIEEINRDLNATPD